MPFQLICYLFSAIIFHLVLSLLLGLLGSLGLLSGELHGLGNSAFTETGVEAARKSLKIALAPGPGGPSSVGLHAPVVCERKRKMKKRNKKMKCDAM